MLNDAADELAKLGAEEVPSRPLWFKRWRDDRRLVAKRVLEYMARFRVKFSEAKCLTVTMKAPEKGRRPPPLNKKRARRSALVPHLFVEIGGVLACRRCRKFSATNAGQDKLRETNCRGKFGAWWDDIHHSHVVANSGPYVFCACCGCMANKFGRKLRDVCVGVRPKVGAPHTRLKRLLEGKDLATGAVFADDAPLPPT